MPSALDSSDQPESPGSRDWIFTAILVTCFAGALAFVLWGQISASAAGGCGGG